MCIVSMIADHYRDKWYPNIPSTGTASADWEKIFNPPATRKELEELKEEVEELKKLLARAKAYDEQNKEPNCEMEDKMKLLKAVARAVGIDLDEVLKTK